MNIQSINSYTQPNMAKKQISFKDIDGAEFSWQTKTPYQRDMEALDDIFYTRLKGIEKKFTDSTQRAKALDKLWTEKESAEKLIKEHYGIIKKRNIFQRLFNLK